MSRYTAKYTEAERIAFKILPETCPAVEEALDGLLKGPAEELIEKVLKSYRIELTKDLRYAIHEICMKSNWEGRHKVRQAVLFNGTYPLRLALVQQIEATLPGPQPEPEIRKWLRMWNREHPLLNSAKH